LIRQQGKRMHKKKHSPGSHCLAIIVSILLGACSSQPQLPQLSDNARILAFGDSLTYGTGSRPDENYPAVLARLTGLEVINEGIPGEITSAGLARLSGVLDTERPQLMILCHGGNDMLRKEDIHASANNLRAMIHLAQDQGIPVLLIAVPKPGLLLAPPDFYEEIAREMNVPIEKEILSDLLSNRSLKSDTIHPNAKGYKMMAESIFQLMKESGLIPEFPLVSRSKA